MKKSISLKSILNKDFSYVQDEFVRQVEEYRKSHGYSQVDMCNLVGEGIDEPKLSKLLNKKSGVYGLRLMGHFLMLFVMKGVVNVKKLGLRNDEVESLFLRLAPVLEDEELIYMIGEAKKLGRDPKAVLRLWLNDIKEVSSTKDSPDKG